MRLSRFTDYGLRTLIALACVDGKNVFIEQISRGYGISFNHLAKVVQALTRAGWVKSTRGRSGGLALVVDPDQLTVGEVVRRLEPSLDLLECFDPSTDQCVISGICSLKGAFQRAQAAFLAELDRVTLAELTGQRQALVSLLAVGPAHTTARGTHTSGAAKMSP